MTRPERVETPRLVLVRPQATDAQAVFAYASDPDVVSFMAWPRHRTVEDTIGYLAWSDQHWERHAAGPYLIQTREDGRVIGSTGFTFDDDGGAMTGYVLERSAWGRGFATEALGAVVSIAQSIGLAGLYAFCHPDHAASIRVLDKCGFLRDESAVTLMVFPNLAGSRERDVLCYRRWC